MIMLLVLKRNAPSIRHGVRKIRFFASSTDFLSVRSCSYRSLDIRQIVYRVHMSLNALNMCRINWGRCAEDWWHQPGEGRCRRTPAAAAEASWRRRCAWLAGLPLASFRWARRRRSIYICNSLDNYVHIGYSFPICFVLRPTLCSIWRYSWWPNE